MTQAKRSNPSPSDADIERVLRALRRDSTPTIAQQEAARSRLLREAAGRPMLPPADDTFTLFTLMRDAALTWLAGSAQDRTSWRRGAYLLYGLPHHYDLNHFLSQRLLIGRV
jgi:hypothetical protein